jgi:hypothetical protein
MQADLDVLKMIRDIRELKVQTKALFSVEQRKLTKRLAERAISCSESVSSCSPSEDKDRGLNSPTEMYPFLDPIASDLNLQNRRLLAMFLKIKEAQRRK